jgi:hypothetical protein
VINTPIGKTKVGSKNTLKKNAALLIIFTALTCVNIILYLTNRKETAEAVPCIEQRVVQKSEISDALKKEALYGSVTIEEDSETHRKLSTLFHSILVVEHTYERTSNHGIYISKDSDIVVPSILSDYNFISIHNNHGLTEHYDLGNLPFTDKKFTQTYTSEGDNFIVEHYTAKDGYWAHLELKKAHNIPREIKYWHKEKLNPNDIQVSSGITIHTKTQDLLEEYKNLVLDNARIHEGTSTATTIHEVPRRILKEHTFTDPTGTYSLYTPQHYRQTTSESSPNALTLRSGNNTMCIPLKGISRDPCGFSTSGCTCCNTGCGFFDNVLYVNQEGEFQIETVLDKGNGGGHPVFVYEPENPWVVYTASYSSGDTDYKKGVIELMVSVDSIERTY